MTHLIRAARATDVPALVSLMQAFYAEASFPLAAEPAARAFGALLADDRLGAIWIASEGGAALGHVVLTVCYSMEYGGLRGFIDDLFVLRAARGRGIAADLLESARAGAVARGARALHVEVGPDNDVARRLYARAGFVDSGHLLLSHPLAPPVHAA